jgi:hypothetical protein
VHTVYLISLVYISLTLDFASNQQLKIIIRTAYLITFVDISVGICRNYVIPVAVHSQKFPRSGGVQCTIATGQPDRLGRRHPDEQPHHYSQCQLCKMCYGIRELEDVHPPTHTIRLGGSRFLSFYVPRERLKVTVASKRAFTLTSKLFSCFRIISLVVDCGTVLVALGHDLAGGPGHDI